MPNPKYREGRLIMEAVAILHSRGFVRLKLLSYFKEGIATPLAA
jgi:hypothetical protein